jgi:hypothetical protein
MYIGNGEIACDPPARLLSCSSIQLLRLWATATPSDSLGQPVDGCGKWGYLVVDLVGLAGPAVGPGGAPLLT